MSTDNFCFYLQNRLIQTSQTGGQRYSNTSPFSIPCNSVLKMPAISLSIFALRFIYTSDFIGEFHINLSLSVKTIIFSSFFKTWNLNVKSDIRVNEPLLTFVCKLSLRFFHKSDFRVRFWIKQFHFWELMKFVLKNDLI
jgi:hypothetical protein